MTREAASEAAAGGSGSSGESELRATGAPPGVVVIVAGGIKAEVGAAHPSVGVGVDQARPRRRGARRGERTSGGCSAARSGRSAERPRSPIRVEGNSNRTPSRVMVESRVDLAGGLVVERLCQVDGSIDRHDQMALGEPGLQRGGALQAAVRRAVILAFQPTVEALVEIGDARPVGRCPAAPGTAGGRCGRIVRSCRDQPACAPANGR